MDKTPEHCLPSMGTQLLVGGLNFDGLSPCVELDYRGHRLVSRDRVVFTLDLFHSQQLPNGGYFSTALFRLRICQRCRLTPFNPRVQRGKTGFLPVAASRRDAGGRFSRAIGDFLGNSAQEATAKIARHSSTRGLKEEPGASCRGPHRSILEYSSA